MRQAKKWLIWVVLVGMSIPESGMAFQTDLLVTSPNSDTIERFDGLTGDYLGEFVSAGSGGLNGPNGVAVGPDGNVYVTSAVTQQVLRYDGNSGDFIDVFSSGIQTGNNVRFHGDYMYVGQFAGGANGLIKRFDAITGAFVDDFIESTWVDGFEFGSDSIYVSNFFGGVGRFDLATGDFIEQLIENGSGGLDSPTAILLLDNDDLLVSSYDTNSVKRYSSDGTYLGDAITDLMNPEGLAFGPNGNLFAGSYTEGVIYEYDPTDFSLIGEFANSGPVTNFFVFRTNAIPEPCSSVPILVVAALAMIRRRKTDL